jgi:hypothetical protein
MPKCAGTSIKQIISNNGDAHITYDYNSFFRLPLSERSILIKNRLNEPNIPPIDSIIYGHFFPVKYIGSQQYLNKHNTCLVTILREPIQRLISHYIFWSTIGQDKNHYLCRKMKSLNWSFLDFAFSPEMKDFYAQHLSYIPLELFSYIGIHEDLLRSTNESLKILRVNSNNIKELPHLNSAAEIYHHDLEKDTQKKLMEYHSEDYRIYNFAIKRFHT